MLSIYTQFSPFMLDILNDIKSSMYDLVLNMLHSLCEVVLTVMVFLLNFITANAIKLFSIDTNTSFANLFFNSSNSAFFSVSGLTTTLQTISVSLITLFATYKLFTLLFVQFGYNSDESALTIFSRTIVAVILVFLIPPLLENNGLIRNLCSAPSAAVAEAGESDSSEYFSSLVDSFESADEDLYGNSDDAVIGKPDFDNEILEKFFYTVCLLFAVIVLWKPYLILLIEMAERYILFNILMLFSPLACIMFPSKSTANVFNAYWRMVGSEAFVFFANNLFLYMFLNGLGNLSITEIVPQILMLYGLLKVAQHFDEYVNQLGLNTARTGAGLGLEVLSSANNISKRLHSIGNKSNSPRNIPTKSSSSTPQTKPNFFSNLGAVLSRSPGENYNVLKNNIGNKMKDAGHNIANSIRTNHASDKKLADYAVWSMDHKTNDTGSNPESLMRKIDPSLANVPLKDVRMENGVLSGMSINSDGSRTLHEFSRHAPKDDSKPWSSFDFGDQTFYKTESNLADSKSPINSDTKTEMDLTAPQIEPLTNTNIPTSTFDSASLAETLNHRTIGSDTNRDYDMFNVQDKGSGISVPYLDANTGETKYQDISYSDFNKAAHPGYEINGSLQGSWSMTSSESSNLQTALNGVNSKFDLSSSISCITAGQSNISANAFSHNADTGIITMNDGRNYACLFPTAGYKNNGPIKYPETTINGYTYIVTPAKVGTPQPGYNFGVTSKAEPLTVEKPPTPKPKKKKKPRP